jgi:hypothetical protein
MLLDIDLHNNVNKPNLAMLPHSHLLTRQPRSNAATGMSEGGCTLDTHTNNLLATHVQHMVLLAKKHMTNASNEQ